MIAALGIVYGTLLGGLLGSVGLITGGLLGYALIRSSARRYVQRVVTPSSLHKMESVFDQNGAGPSSSLAAFRTASPRSWSFSPDWRACRRENSSRR